MPRTPVAAADGLQRRRDDVLLAALRQATRAELAEYGYSGVTFAGVARRAQTAKHVLYRRYTSRAHMVLDALPPLRWTPHTANTQGSSLREDLLGILSALLDRFQQIGTDTFRGLLNEIDDESLDDVIDEISLSFTEAMRTALARAADREEIGTATVPDRVIKLPLTLLRDDLLLARRNVTQRDLVSMVDDVLIPLTTQVTGTR